ncbi:GAF domain-containing protein [Nocardia sp. NPDC051787]|uniref:GAF domain-containing protein n=1 Tax=Nocardia sp. NPDC051787 TaxID=3155415 RepID=UPI00341F08CA
MRTRPQLNSCYRHAGTLDRGRLMERGHNELLIETIGTEPRVVAENGRVRDFRKVSSVLRGAERSLVEDLVDDVVGSGQSAVRSGRNGAAGKVYIGHPLVGVDNVVAGVQVLYGTDVSAQAARTAAFQWELDIAGGPPRLHLTGDFLDIVEMPQHERDRSVYGPLDFLGRVARLPDLVRMWEAIVAARPEDSVAGTLMIRTGAGRPRMLIYAQRYVSTDVGPRLRGICQDITASADIEQLRIDMLDTAVASSAIEAQGMFGIIVDTRWPTTCVLKWLTPYAPGWGHGVSTGQTPGMHPDDIVRVPGLVEEAIEKGIVRAHVRVRSGLANGWVNANFVARLIDPEVSTTLGLAMVYPDTTDPVDG